MSTKGSARRRPPYLVVAVVLSLAPILASLYLGWAAVAYVLIAHRVLLVMAAVAPAGARWLLLRPTRPLAAPEWAAPELAHQAERHGVGQAMIAMVPASEAQAFAVGGPSRAEVYLSHGALASLDDDERDALIGRLLAGAARREPARCARGLVFSRGLRSIILPALPAGAALLYLLDRALVVNRLLWQVALIPRWPRMEMDQAALTDGVDARALASAFRVCAVHAGSSPLTPQAIAIDTVSVACSIRLESSGPAIVRNGRVTMLERAARLDALAGNRRHRHALADHDLPPLDEVAVDATATAAGAATGAATAAPESQVVELPPPPVPPDVPPLAGDDDVAPAGSIDAHELLGRRARRGLFGRRSRAIPRSDQDGDASMDGVDEGADEGAPLAPEHVTSAALPEVSGDLYVGDAGPARKPRRLPWRRTTPDAIGADLSALPPPDAEGTPAIAPTDVPHEASLGAIPPADMRPVAMPLPDVAVEPLPPPPIAAEAEPAASYAAEASLPDASNVSPLPVLSDTPHIGDDVSGPRHPDLGDAAGPPAALDAAVAPISAEELLAAPAPKRRFRRRRTDVGIESEVLPLPPSLDGDPGGQWGESDDDVFATHVAMAAAGEDDRDLDPPAPATGAPAEHAPVAETGVSMAPPRRGLRGLFSRRAPAYRDEERPEIPVASHLPPPIPVVVDAERAQGSVDAEPLDHPVASDVAHGEIMDTTPSPVFATPDGGVTDVHPDPGATRTPTVSDDAVAPPVSYVSAEVTKGPDLDAPPPVPAPIVADMVTALSDLPPPRAVTAPSTDVPSGDVPSADVPAAAPFVPDDAAPPAIPPVPSTDTVLPAAGIATADEAPPVIDPLTPGDGPRRIRYADPIAVVPRTPEPPAPVVHEDDESDEEFVPVFRDPLGERLRSLRRRR